jgi:tetratricopeptide (TPR) repeat protein
MDLALQPVCMRGIPRQLFFFTLAVLSFAQVCLSQTPASSTPAVNTAPVGANRCVPCHPKEVAGYAQSAMAHALRSAGKEPEGSVTANGTTITMRNRPDGYWQTRESGGEKEGYRVDYVVGSGNHANGYLVDVGGHLFQSPAAYYQSRSAYDLAPGFESTPNPDFTRPVSVECLLCHSGKALRIPETLNWYATPPFAEEAISCERCHGPVGRHLADPRAGTIVDPTKLEPAARDSICEQCHLFGAARVPNPGKQLRDFVPGQRLEDTFTIYHDVALEGAPGEFKVISHVEQLALSACARNSGGRLWCGTCHNPHEKPAEPVAYYRTRCLTCHTGNFPEAHPTKDSNCLECHMPRRPAKDGGHTAFTDHRIQRRPEAKPNLPANTRIAAWREPSTDLQKRNLGIAYIDVGTQRRSSTFVIQGYRLLTEVQRQFASDPEFFKWIGEALLLAKRTPDAKLAFERALQLEPNSALTEAGAAAPYIEEGDTATAIAHLERAMQLDPLDLPAATTLLELYQKEGKQQETTQLASRMSAAFTQAPLPNRNADAGKKAEDAFKNIQVFQGLPANELLPAMEFMAASLGVQCSYCHLEGQPEKDDKKPKKTAREMMKMAATVNAESFNGQRVLTCYSCHRGAITPSGTPDLNLAKQAGAEKRASETPVRPQNLPTVDQVLLRYLDALGGTAAIGKIKNRAMKGTSGSAGSAESVELDLEFPGKYALIQRRGKGDLVASFDGESGWTMVPGHGARNMTDAEMDFARRDGDPQFPLHLQKFFPDLRMEYPEKAEGAMAYVLVGARSGGRSVKFYFDQSSGLLVKETRLAESPLGLIPTDVEYADYREVDGVRIPFRVTIRKPGSIRAIQFDQAEQNLQIDPAKFARPDTAQQATPSAPVTK